MKWLRQFADGEKLLTSVGAFRVELNRAFLRGAVFGAASLWLLTRGGLWTAAGGFALGFGLVSVRKVLHRRPGER